MLDHPLLKKQASDDTPRRSHIIFGCLCDSRRGSIGSSAITIVASIVYIILLFIFHHDPQRAQKHLEQPVIDSLDHNYPIIMIVCFLTVFIALIVICGALIYNSTWIILGMTWTIINCILDLVVNVPLIQMKNARFSIIIITLKVLWTAIKIYIDSVFVYEIKKDIMNPEMYKRERYSLCGCCMSCDKDMI